MVLQNHCLTKKQPVSVQPEMQKRGVSNIKIVKTIIFLFFWIYGSFRLFKICNFHDFLYHSIHKYPFELNFIIIISYFFFLKKVPPKCKNLGLTKVLDSFLMQKKSCKDQNTPWYWWWENQWDYGGFLFCRVLFCSDFPCFLSFLSMYYFIIFKNL